MKFPRQRALKMIIVMALVLCGCNYKISSEPVKDNKIYGPVYSLPMLQYEMSITRRITSCTVIGQNNPTFIMSVEAKEIVSADPEATLLIDYNELTTATNVANISVDYYENGSLKSVTANAEDRTSDIIMNTIAAAGKIALMVAGVPTPVIGSKAQAEGEKPYEFVHECDSDIIKSLEELKKSEEPLAEAKKDLDDKTLAFQTAKLNLDVLPEPTDTALGELEEAHKEMQKATEKLEDIQKSRAPFLKLVEVTTPVFIWPKSGNVRLEWPKNNQHFQPSTRLFRDWFNAYKDNLDGDEDWKYFQDRLSIMAEIITKSALAGNQNDNSPITGESGIITRKPVSGYLMLYKKNQKAGSDAFELIQKVEGQFPQLGPFIVLPFKGGAFSKKFMSVTFDSLGGVQQFKYGQEVSPADRFAAAAAGGTEQLYSLKGELDQKQLRLLQQDTAIMQQQVALKELENQLMSLSGVDVSGKIVEVQAEAALLRAKEAMAQAVIANTQAAEKE